jgi:hypothetical protein
VGDNSRYTNKPILRRALALLIRLFHTLLLLSLSCGLQPLLIFCTSTKTQSHFFSRPPGRAIFWLTHMFVKRKRFDNTFIYQIFSTSQYFKEPILAFANPDSYRDRRAKADKGGFEPSTF